MRSGGVREGETLFPVPLWLYALEVLEMPFFNFKRNRTRLDLEPWFSHILEQEAKCGFLLSRRNYVNQ
jgi:hypothetical protein